MVGDTYNAVILIVILLLLKKIRFIFEGGGLVEGHCPILTNPSVIDCLVLSREHKSFFLQLAYIYFSFFTSRFSITQLIILIVSDE